MKEFRHVQVRTICVLLSAAAFALDQIACTCRQIVRHIDKDFHMTPAEFEAASKKLPLVFAEQTKKLADAEAALAQSQADLAAAQATIAGDAAVNATAQVVTDFAATLPEPTPAV